MSLPHEYRFKRMLDLEKVKALKRSWKWFGQVEVDDYALKSERPMPPGLYAMFERLSEVETSSLDLYQACKELYTQVLNEGERAFPLVPDLFQKYGFAANCVLAGMIDMKEATQRLGRKTTRKFLSLAMGRNVQPSLFD